MSESIPYPRISAAGLANEGQQVIDEWNRSTYDDPELAAHVLDTMVEAPHSLSLDSDEVRHYHSLTGLLLEATENGRILDFPGDEVFETERHQRLLGELKKVRNSGDAAAREQALRLLSVDLLSRHVSIVTDYKTQQNPPSVA